MYTYSYKIMTDKGWSKRGVRVTARNTDEAHDKAVAIYESKGYKAPMLMKWKYV